MPPRLLDRAEVLRQLDDLPGWELLARRLHARFEAATSAGAAALVHEVLELAEEVDHHPDLDVRYRTVVVRCWTHVSGGVTQHDVELAHRVEEVARRLRVPHAPAVPHRYEIGVDTTDAGRVAPFWAAVLGYEAVGDPADPQLVDPRGTGPEVWFQVTDGAATGRNRLHVDVSVVASEAAERIDAALVAGGRLVTDAYAPRWWVLADADGNEVCVCTEEGRGL